MDVMTKLQRNPKTIYQEAVRLLTKIAENILNQPNNQKLRTLQKSNKTISDKVLNVFGGTECLLSMGFVESNSCLTLPQDACLDKLKRVQEEIIKCQKLYVENNGTIPKDNVKKVENNVVEKEQELIKKIELPPFRKKYQNEFLHNVAYRFHLAQIHDDKYLHSRAQGLIPVRQLEINAQENLRELQRQSKKDKIGDLEVSLQDLLILELLNWFKNDFFSWVDSPKCENCGGVTKFSYMSSDSNMLKYTDRVEMHKCNSCNSETPFPRYNDLNILMETRKGRCGEWANCFTLFCRAMGWDSRHVFDETDHVWTEVYSFHSKRWLHCDPCENVCDSPLMYESGWNKQVSYVIAYSGEEVQDVTWRYSSNHKQVLSRRVKCSEQQLVECLVSLRNERQKTLSEARRKYLAKRILEEICELMVEKQPTDKDKKGRDSGSLGWRLARGEQHLSNFESYTWKFTDVYLNGGPICFQYSSALNRYQLMSQHKSFTLQDWHKGVFEVENVFRKEEKDWKMVYLARTEKANVGKIKWAFEIDSPSKVFDTIDVQLDHTLYENAKIDISIKGNSKEIILSPNQKTLETDALSGSNRIEILVTLTGGKGDVAWQHAQLFRQSLDSGDYCFNVTFTIKDV